MLSVWWQVPLPREPYHLTKTFVFKTRNIIATKLIYSKMSWMNTLDLNVVGVETKGPVWRPQW